MNPRYPRFALLASALLVTSLKLSAQEVSFNWDGSGNSDTGGDWMTGSNWSTDAVPANTSTSVAGLVNVTSGTRTITIKNGETATAKRLLFTQTTAGAFNILSVESGGTLQLGGGQTWAAPTAGTSRVDLAGTIDFTGFVSGVVVNTDLTFTNAGAVFRASNTNTDAPFTFGGNVNVNAGAGVAQIAFTGTNSGRTLTATFGGALNVNTGVLDFNTTVTTRNAVAVNVIIQGATTLAAGTELRLTTPTSGTGSAGVALSNSGTLSQAGKIIMSGRGNNVGATNTLTNSGAWKVNGLSVEIEKATNNGALNPTFVNSSTGVFSGATAADKIDYNHLQTPGTDLTFNNSGVIAAGNGSNGSGLTSVGTLTLVDFAVTNAVTTSSLVFDIGGTSAGQFDVLAFQSGSLVLTNATLAINLVNGFTPGSSFSVDILTSVSSSITGSFVGLTVNGSANADYSFTYNDTTGIGTLTYTAASIPEPSTYAIVAGLVTLGLAIRRRRAGNVSA